MKKNDCNERALTLTELVCAVLTVSIVLFFGGVSLAQMTVRVDNATKVISDPTNSVFWASNADGIHDAIGTNYAPASHVAATNNPHAVTKSQVGLANVDNTSDANKPVSTAQQAALDLKLDDSQASAFGLSLLDDADAATARATLGLNGAALLNVGTTAGTVAAGDDSRIVAGGTSLQPGAAATGLNMATARILGRTTAGSGAVEELTYAQVKSALAIAAADVTDFATASQAVGDARYPQLSGSYANPAFITALAWSKLTGVPDYQPLDGDLTVLAGNTSLGLWAYTGVGTGAARTLTAPVAGITIANPSGTAGNPTFALANDLAGLEGLGSTGFAVRTGADTWAQRAVAGTTNYITVTNGDGVSGNATVNIGANVVTTDTVQTMTARKRISAALSIGADPPAGYNSGSYHALWMPNGTALMPEDSAIYAGLSLSSNVMRRTSPNDWYFADSTKPAWRMTIGHGSAVDAVTVNRSAATTYSEVSLWKIDSAGKVTSFYDSQVNGNFTAGDAAGDDFVANDDDPRFPNLTAASFAAAGDNKVALNGEVGDARYLRSTTIVITSDLTLPDSTALADVSGLSVTLESGGRYFIEARICASNQDNVTGLKLAWSFSGTAPTVREYRRVLYPGAGGNVSVTAPYFVLGAEQSATGFTDLQVMQATFTAPTSGTWTLQAAKVATGANNTVIRANSSMRIQKLN